MTSDGLLRPPVHKLLVEFCLALPLGKELDWQVAGCRHFCEPRQCPRNPLGIVLGRSGSRDRSQVLGDNGPLTSTV